MEEDKRKIVIEKLKSYLDEKLGLSKDESYVILSLLRKDYLEEMTEEDFDLEEELDDIDDDIDEDEPEEVPKEPKKKTVIKKPKLEVKGAKEEKPGEKNVPQSPCE